MMSLAAFQEKMGFQFVDQSILIRSLTHPSYANEHPEADIQDNERLEFLGDAVLDFISGEWLYVRFPDEPEGYLTRLRAALVRTERLADFAKQCHIGDALLLGRGDEDGGGRHRPGNLCAGFEAVVGAIYLDQGLNHVRDFVLPFFEAALEEILRLDLDKNAKSVLQEWSHTHLGLTPSYVILAADGPDHAKQITVGVYLGDKLIADGSGSSKQIAGQIAAQRALDSLVYSSRH